MTQNRSTSASFAATIEGLAARPRIEYLGPVAARFLYSLRLIALHERVMRDPIPELSVRLSSVETAAKAYALSQEIAAVWPENVQLSCFCSPVLTHDEATVGALVDAAGQRDRPSFESAIDGLVRPDRAQRLWEPVLALIAAEMHAA